MADKDEFYNRVDTLYVSNNFPALERLYKLVKEAHPEISKQYVKRFLDAQQETQLLKRRVRIPNSGYITAAYPFQKLNIDIFDYSKFLENNNGYRYILACVDVFSRKAYCEPLHTKSSDELTSNLYSIFLQSKAIPTIIISDNDAAYHGKPFQDMLSEHHILHSENVPGDHNAMGIIDAFAKKLKIILSKYFLRNRKTRWLKILPEIIKTYNNTPHSGIADLTPNQALKPENRPIIGDINLEKQLMNKRTSDLESGDKVRRYTANKFSKKSEPVWSDEVYTVNTVRGNTIYLTDGSSARRDYLLKCSPDAVSSEPNAIPATKKTR